MRNCLKSIFEHTKDIFFEVIVSDNGSTDGSVEMIKTEFPQVVLIENNVNLGFCVANNRGLDIAKGKYIFT
ncbi:MAG: glycosyltransferase [Treponema sp.]|nr:glycosyltransferase [Treponema sp.]